MGPGRARHRGPVESRGAETPSDFGCSGKAGERHRRHLFWQGAREQHLGRDSGLRPFGVQGVLDYLCCLLRRLKLSLPLCSNSAQDRALFGNLEHEAAFIATASACSICARS